MMSIGEFWVLRHERHRSNASSRFGSLANALLLSRLRRLTS